MSVCLANRQHLILGLMNGPVGTWVIAADSIARRQSGEENHEATSYLVTLDIPSY